VIKYIKYINKKIKKMVVWSCWKDLLSLTWF